MPIYARLACRFDALPRPMASARILKSYRYIGTCASPAHESHNHKTSDEDHDDDDDYDDAT